MKIHEPGANANKSQSCVDCEHANHFAPFKVSCNAGEGVLGDMYASGMLTNGRCVKNRRQPLPAPPSGEVEP